MLQQNSSNGYLFQQIYEPRIPTITHLSRRFAYLGEDIESEINVVFIKSLEKFKSSSRDFNTFFYTNVLNHMRNMMKSSKRQKRTLLDGSDPSFAMVRLDDGADDERSPHDVIASPSNVLSSVSVSEMIEIVRRQSWVLYDIMIEIASYGSPCIKRHIYDGEVEMLDGESEEDAVARNICIPRSIYCIKDLSRNEQSLSFRISVSSQNAIKHLSSFLKKKGFSG